MHFSVQYWLVCTEFEPYLWLCCGVTWDVVPKQLWC